MSMLALPAISVPLHSNGLSDSGSLYGGQESVRFPHTRAQLVAIARQYRSPSDAYETDADGEDARISSGFVSKVANLLDNEDEDEIKTLLKDTFGSSIDEEELEQHVLDLMHKHKDDLDNVPFSYLTPTRRPISRPSSRASTHSARFIPNRPDTPISASAPGSPLAMIFKRPHTPVVSPLGLQQSSSYMTAHNESPSSSPIFTTAQFTSSLPASPLSSPRLLNARANEFKPIPRPLSAASSNPGSLAALRDQTPSPDLWAHNPTRPTSKLAIAAPLTPESALLPRSATPSSLRMSLRPGEDDEEDPFDPFSARQLPRSFHDPDAGEGWSNSPLSVSSMPHEHSYPSLGNGDSQSNSMTSPDSDLDMDPEAAALLTDGMTPFDVLSSVFGATLAPSELEDALAVNGYDFERAMSWLVDRQMVTQVGPQHTPAPARLQNLGNRVMIMPRDAQGGFVRGGRAGYGNAGARSTPRYVNGRPVPGGNRVCRYFLAGECLRADCRFSHDLERALCRFWLRGTCAKGENCEFLHHLPKDIDVSGLTNAMQRTEISPSSPDPARSQSPDEFPTLGFAANRAKRNSHSFGHEPGYHDPGRTRFAAAVKRTATVPSPAAQVPKDPATMAARREAMGPAAEPLHHNAAIVAPKPSPRIKLRPPTLLPTLPTGEAVNSLYMAYRSRALRLGAARNACLSRAADAWRRGDGAAAKRFSREGHDLNAKMSSEMVDAAGKLVRERARLSEQVVRARDLSWSDDYGDRAARGRPCGGALGVCLGVASRDAGADSQKLTPEERSEVMLDLHGLHSAEATEVLEQFLLALEREHFYGLAYLIVGEEKHTGTQDPARGASRARLAAGVREWLHLWGYPWSERDGIICVDPLTHG